MEPADWVIWFAAAGVLVAVEIFTGTFYLLMLALGFAAGGLAALLGFGLSVQLVIAAAIGSVATVMLNRSRFGARNKKKAVHDPNVNLDIGKTLMVDAWGNVPNAPRQARVSYRGTMWDVELKPEAEARPGLFVIREVRANRLIVENAAD